jgi:hypothetical protein
MRQSIDPALFLESLLERIGDFLFSHAQERDVNEEKMPERGRAQGKRKVWDLMRHVKPDRARRDVHIWSPAPASALPGYHNIWEGIKEALLSGRSGRRGSWGRNRDIRPGR